MDIFVGSLTLTWILVRFHVTMGFRVAFLVKERSK
jgi:hypothetical protein